MPGLNMQSLEGKVALAAALAAAGAKVIVSDIADCTETTRQIAKLGGEAITVPADVTDNKSLAELVAVAETTLGPINILINNAGIFGTLELKPLMHISED